MYTAVIETNAFNQLFRQYDLHELGHDLGLT